MANSKPFVHVPATSVTTTSKWFITDSRFNENPERAYAGVQGAGGTVLVQVAVSTADALTRNGGGANPTMIFTVNTITSTVFDGTLHGSWPCVRFISYGGNTTASIALVG